MTEKTRSTTFAFKAVFKCIAGLCALLLAAGICNEAVFYFCLNAWPGRGDYLIEMERKAVNYQRYFIGSSRTELAVNTPLYDSLNGTENENFNLGSSSQTIIDQYLTLENLISSDKDLKECVFELVAPNFDNYYKPVSYTNSLPEVFRFSGNLPPRQRYDLVTGVLKKRFRLLINYYANDRVLDSVNSRQGYLLRKLAFLEYTGAEQRENVYVSLTPNKEQKDMQAVVEIIVRRIIERCKKKRIRVLFLLPVQVLKAESAVLGAVWKNLPPAVKWETSNHELWQELRRPRYWRDFLHTNENGAALYTKILSETYPQL